MGSLPRLLPLLAATLLSAAPAWSQYPGQVKKSAKDAPPLRAIAVLEWTGDAGKPKASRIVPLTIYDGEKLQDAGIYMARPAPLALSYEVEYELEQDGKPFGLYDIKNAGQEQGSWVGFGAWKALPRPKPAQASLPEKIDDVGDDKPVLHRKKGSEDSTTQPSDRPAGTSNSTNSSDDDRPKLHKKSEDSTSSSAPAPDSDRPVLHKPADENAKDTPPAGGKNPSENSGSPPAGSDPDRPTLKKDRPRPADEVAQGAPVADDADPDRPRLKRGKSSGPAAPLVPTLMGLPEDMEQAVAVSDSRTRPAHPWSYSWANPDDEAKMKAALEETARQALGLESAPAPAPPAAHRSATAAHRTPRPAASKPKPAPEPAPLQDEQFRVFELAYGSGATMVLTAGTSEPLPQRKYVTLIAQPDLYGKPLILFKSVTDMAHLDQTPRMRLVDAVDALADNRGELVFELRGDGSRQFALYRVYRGAAEQMFVSGGEPYATTASNE